MLIKDNIIKDRPVAEILQKELNHTWKECSRLFINKEHFYKCSSEFYSGIAHEQRGEMSEALSVALLEISGC